MSDDWQRLSELEQLKGTLQYGQYLQVEPSPGDPDLVLVSKDLIRFVGEKTDINALRVYLGPWQPSPNITIDPILLGPSAVPPAPIPYADPTPWAPPRPFNYDSMLHFPMYARIMWGSGGLQHSAFVDWPMRGCVIQVSGSYLQVNGFANVGSPAISIDQLPLLTATMSPEPGGGDSVMPATFTYNRDNSELLVAGTDSFTYRIFQIPPFARSFIPLIDYDRIVNAFGGPLTASIRCSVVNRPLIPTGAFLTEVQQTWAASYLGVFDPDFNREPFPLGGQRGGCVVIEFQPAILGNVGDMGCMFLLDL